MQQYRSCNLDISSVNTASSNCFRAFIWQKINSVGHTNVYTPLLIFKFFLLNIQSISAFVTNITKGDCVAPHSLSVNCLILTSGYCLGGVLHILPMSMQVFTRISRFLRPRKNVYIVVLCNTIIFQTKVYFNTSVSTMSLSNSNSLLTMNE